MARGDSFRGHEMGNGRVNNATNTKDWSSGSDGTVRAEDIMPQLSLKGGEVARHRYEAQRNIDVL